MGISFVQPNGSGNKKCMKSNEIQVGKIGTKVFPKFGDDHHNEIENKKSYNSKTGVMDHLFSTAKVLQPVSRFLFCHRQLFAHLFLETWGNQETLQLIK